MIALSLRPQWEKRSVPRSLSPEWQCPEKWEQTPDLYAWNLIAGKHIGLSISTRPHSRSSRNCFCLPTANTNTGQKYLLCPGPRLTVTSVVAVFINEPAGAIQPRCRVAGSHEGCYLAV